MADSFNPNANSNVLSLAVQADGKIVAGGVFATIGGQTRNRIARLDPTTGLADSFNPNANGNVLAIAVQADGKILAVGAFNGANSIGGQTRNYIARLDSDGRLDQTLNLSIVGSFVNATAVQPDGKILIGGLFDTVLGVTRNNIARLNPDGTLDTTFNPNANADVFAIAVQEDGKILAGGEFNSIGGQMRSGIARLDATTGLADSFNPNATGSNPFVVAIAVQPDGKILVGGLFTAIGGQPRNYIARLDPTTGLADSFDPNASNHVYSIVVQADGKILAGGLFNGANSIGGQARNRIARLDSITGLADSFDPNSNGDVYSIAVEAGGKVLVGGTFFGANSIGGQPRNFFARLSNDTAALQNLGVTQTTITWTRGGSSAQFTRVTFESSNDNVTYTSLGNGTAAGGNWTLTGLNLPTGQNFYIRARGYYRSGGDNGSESITESVRNVFVGQAPLLTSAFSRKTHGAAGTFDIPLPLTGNVGVECRSDGATNNYQMIFNFINPVTVGSGSVTSGTGSVSSLSVSGSEVTVNLTGVTNAQRITVTLFNVNDGTHMGDVPLQMGVLVGDVNGNAVVNAADVSLTKSVAGQVISGSNFRADVNANGTLNASDAAIVKQNAGTSLP